MPLPFLAEQNGECSKLKKCKYVGGGVFRSKLRGTRSMLPILLINIYECNVRFEHEHFAHEYKIVR